MNTSEQKLRITGMTCSHCSARVEKALKELNGVADAKVNLEENNAVVKFDSGTLTTDNLVQTVEDAGYSAALM